MAGRRPRGVMNEGQIIEAKHVQGFFAGPRYERPRLFLSQIPFLLAP